MKSKEIRQLQIPKEIYSQLFFFDSETKIRLLYGIRERKRWGYVSYVQGSLLINRNDELQVIVSDLFREENTDLIGFVCYSVGEYLNAKETTKKIFETVLSVVSKTMSLSPETNITFENLFDLIYGINFCHTKKMDRAVSKHGATLNVFRIKEKPFLMEINTYRQSFCSIEEKIVDEILGVETEEEFLRASRGEEQRKKRPNLSKEREMEIQEVDELIIRGGAIPFSEEVKEWRREGLIGIKEVETSGEDFKNEVEKHTKEFFKYQKLSYALNILFEKKFIDVFDKFQ